MLQKSGVNLQTTTFDFIKSNESITILCPYVKVQSLDELIGDCKVKQIIVRWKIQDLVQRATDLELFEFCQQRNITLYRNTRIHLKAFWNNEDSVLFGSANITGSGIGEEGDFNWELNGLCSEMTFKDKLYFQNIIADSELVDQTLFFKIRRLVEEAPKATMEFPQLDTTKKEVDYFLLSQLPMSETPEFLYQVYSLPSDFCKEDQKYALCDLALYKVPTGLNKRHFLEYVANAFNQHPFVLAMKEHIKSTSTSSLHYGGVVAWLQNNTTTVPTPRSWELKRAQIVNILYDWICYFDEQFVWDRPKYSQVIFYKPKPF